MEIVRHVYQMKEICRQIRQRGRKIGFVPTMGSLHDGHLALVRRAKELADESVVSVFVNPAQFDDPEDLERYPRDLARDADLLIAEGVDYVFSPPPVEMYARGSKTWVEVEELSDRLEGASRPGHFRGVATVVLKLLEIVRPTVAVFGQKDAQQVAVVRRMVEDLMLDVEIVALPTERDEDGVALSSRNRRLSPEERLAARAIPEALEAAAGAVEAGEDDPDAIVRMATERLEAEDRVRVDYVRLVDARDFKPVPAVEGDMVLLVAAFVGEVRLIDNRHLRSRPERS